MNLYQTVRKRCHTILNTREYMNFGGGKRFTPNKKIHGRNYLKLLFSFLNVFFTLFQSDLFKRLCKLFLNMKSFPHPNGDIPEPDWNPELCIFDPFISSWGSSSKGYRQETPWPKHRVHRPRLRVELNIGEGILRFLRTEFMWNQWWKPWW